MTIDLRKYYLGSSDELEWDLELSGMELGGVKPFCAPVKIQGELKGSADSVEFRGTAFYSLTMPCDRCFEVATQNREMEFFHVLVRALSDEEDDDGDQGRRRRGRCPRLCRDGDHRGRGPLRAL